MKAKLTFLLWCFLAFIVSSHAQNPQLVVQSNQPWTTAMSFTPDGTIMASGGPDVRLWEVSTGKLITILNGYRGRIGILSFSSDGRLLAGATGLPNASFNPVFNRNVNSDNAIYVWNIFTGKMVVLRGHQKPIHSLLFLSQQRLLSGGDDGTLRLWEADSGNLIQTWQVQKMEKETPLARKNDGAVVASSVSRDNDTLEDVYRPMEEHFLRLRDTSNGTILHSLKTSTGAIPATICFSPDGNQLMAASYYTDPDGRRERDSWKIDVYDSTSGKRLRTITLSGSSSIENYDCISAFSPNGRYWLAANYSGGIHLWDTNTGKEMPQLDMNSEGHFGVFSDTLAIAFHPDGQQFAWAVESGSEGTIGLFKLGSRKVIHTLGTYPQRPIIALAPVPVAAYPEHMMLTSHDTYNHLRMWDLESGILIATVSDMSTWLGAVLLSIDGTMAVVPSGGNREIWDLTQWHMRKLRTFKTDESVLDNNGSLSTLAPDKTVLAAVSEDVVKIYSIDSGKLLHTLQLSDEISALSFSPDSKFLTIGTWEQSIQLWSVSSGKLLRTLQKSKDRVSDFDSGSINSLAFSPDGYLLASSSLDGTTKLWNIANGKSIKTFVDSFGPVGFHPQGKVLISGTKLWDVNSGQLLRVIQNQDSEIRSVAFILDGKVIAAGGADGAIRLYDSMTSQIIATLIVLPNGYSAVVAPDGRFDTNHIDEIKGLHWVMPDDPFTSVPIETFMRQYYEPHLLSRILKGEKFKPVPPLMELNRVQPRVFVHKPEPEPGAPDEVTIQVEVARGTGEYLQDGKKITKTSGVHDLRLFRDGQMVGYVEGEVTLENGRAIIPFHHIKLPHDANKKSVEFSAYAFNVDLVKSDTNRREYSLPALAPHQGKAYIISFGVNASRNPHLNLRYAAPDAQLMASVLKQKLDERNAQTKEYSEVVAIPLLADYGANGKLDVATATKANFANVLHLLAGEPVDAKQLQELKTHIPGIEKIEKATPEDLLIIAFSCHGDLDRDGNFHLLPYDVDESIPEDGAWQKSISSEDLSRWLRYVDAGEMAMIVDACHSAGAVGGEFKPGPMGSRGLGQLAYDKGMMILAASQADNVALESARVRHGLLTYALLKEGIEAGRADNQPKDQKVLLTEWLNYGVSRVPSLAEEVRKGAVTDLKGIRVIVPPSSNAAAQPPAQQPSLFNFKKQRREVILEQNAE